MELVVMNSMLWSRLVRSDLGSPGSQRTTTGTERPISERMVSPDAAVRRLRTSCQILTKWDGYCGWVWGGMELLFTHPARVLRGVYAVNGGASCDFVPLDTRSVSWPSAGISRHA